jgi:molecular chaperone DnaK (HSP70)
LYKKGSAEQNILMYMGGGTSDVSVLISSRTESSR